jgi:hypothetical protein
MISINYDVTDANLTVPDTGKVVPYRTECTLIDSLP